LGCIPAANIFIEAGLDEGGGVLVHCAGGRSRSAAIIAAFLMSTHNMSFDEALAECVKARDLVNVNPGFQIQLHAYGAANCDVHTAHQILIHKRYVFLSFFFRIFEFHV
jgi:dual specificity phosphatase 12